MQRFLNFIPGKGGARRPWRLVTFRSKDSTPEIETFLPSARICEHVSLVVDDNDKGWLQITDDTLTVTPAE